MHHPTTTTTLFTLPPLPPLPHPPQQGPNDPDTLVNLISCYQHLSKPSELIQRHINQLRSGAPNNPMVQQLNTVEGAFDRVAETYALN